MNDMVVEQAAGAITDTVVRVGAAPTETQQYLTFSLGGEMFAVGILNVKEIIEYGELTGIPMMPSFIRGVINLRGALVLRHRMPPAFVYNAARVVQCPCAPSLCRPCYERPRDHTGVLSCSRTYASGSASASPSASYSCC